MGTGDATARLKAQFEATGTVFASYDLGFEDNSVSPQSRGLMPKDPGGGHPGHGLGIVQVHKDPTVHASLKKGFKRVQARIDKWIPKEEGRPSPSGVRCPSGNIWTFSDQTLLSLARKVGALRVDSMVIPHLRMELHNVIKAMTYDSLIVADSKPLKKTQNGEIKLPSLATKHVRAALENLGMSVWQPEDTADPPKKRKRRPPANPWGEGADGSPRRGSDEPDGSEDLRGREGPAKRRRA
jgi:hypothetical protein